MASLTGNSIAGTYEALLKFDDNTGVTSSLKTVTDGAGAATALSLNNTDADIAGALTVGNGITGDLYGTADLALTASYVTGANVHGTVATATTAATASYVVTSQTASFITTAQTASYVVTAQTASFVLLAQTASYLSGSITNAITASYALLAETASFVTTAQTASFVTTAQTASFVTTAQTASFVQIAETATTASYVNLVAGPGIAINGLEVTASVRSVNGSYPVNGNVSVALTATKTGTSASFDLSGSGAITGSLQDGLVWIIANDPTPAWNGDVYIYSSGSVGAWYPVAPLDTAAGDARYLMLTPQSALAGNLDLGGYDLTNGNLAGTASYATTASYVINGGGGGSVLQTQKVTLTSAQILGLTQFGGVTLVPAQGPGTVVRPVYITFNYHHNTTAYVGAQLVVNYNNGGSFMMNTAAPINSPYNKMMYITVGSQSSYWDPTVVGNDDLVLKSYNGTFTGGDGTLDVFIGYEVITL